MDYFVSVSIVEDDRLIRQHLTFILEKAERIKLANVYSSAEEVLSDKSNLEGVILVDVQLPRLCGIDMVRLLKRHHPKLKPLFLSVSNEGATIRKALQVGGCGYLTKPTKPTDLILAIFEVAGGGFPMSKDTMRAFIEDLRSEGDTRRYNCGLEEKIFLLTTSEKETYEHLLLGASSKSIADRMGISTNTVNTHVQHIFHKFNVTCRSELYASIISECRTCDMSNKSD